MPATRLKKRSRTAQSNRTRGYVAHFRKNHYKLLLGYWNVFTHTEKELKLVEEAKKYHFDIVGVSFTKRRASGIVDWMAGGNFSIQVLIQICLLKRVWKFSQDLSCQTVCSIGFL